MMLAADELGLDVEIVAAYDAWDAAVGVYNENLHPVARVGDVKAMSADDLPEHDILIGGPPCQGFSAAGKRLGHEDPRNCIPDFIRLSANSPFWLMENVKGGLLEHYGVDAWSEKCIASDFGDVTTRKRFFYSATPLSIVRTPGPRRFRDIREVEADRLYLAKLAKTPVDRKKGDTRGVRPPDPATQVLGDDEFLPTVTAHSWHGHEQRGGGKQIPVVVGDYAELMERAKARGRNVELVGEDDFMSTITGQSWHGITGGKCMVPIIATRATGMSGIKDLDADEFLPTVTQKTWNCLSDGMANVQVAVRSHSSNARMIDGHDFLGTVTTTTHDGLSEKIGVRCPSLLECQRSHSMPDTWRWGKTTKENRGKMIANGWAVMMGKAACKSLLLAAAAQYEMSAAA
jgi:site-specific DNA-cytosine methylase